MSQYNPTHGRMGRDSTYVASDHRSDAWAVRRRMSLSSATSDMNGGAHSARAEGSDHGTSAILRELISKFQAMAMINKKAAAAVDSPGNDPASKPPAHKFGNSVASPRRKSTVTIRAHRSRSSSIRERRVSNIDGPAGHSRRLSNQSNQPTGIDVDPSQPSATADDTAFTTCV